MRFFFDLISKKRKGLFYDILRGILWLFSLLFSLAVFLRTQLYARGFKKIFRQQVMTVSIGNITAGGTGKTPFTIFLAQKLCRPAVLTRGYKGTSKHACTLVTNSMTAAEVGDEALLITKKVPGAAVYSGKGRVNSAKYAVEAGAKCLLLDDGMQHLQLHRDVEIVMIDCKEPFGYGYLLPRGLLREPLSALSRAHLIVLNRIEYASKIYASKIEDEIRKYSNAPFIKTTMVFDGLYDLVGNKKEPCPTCVGLFCGIGQPEAFYAMVAALGFQIVNTHFLGDHEPFDQQALTAFYERCKEQGAEYLLCTEKDAVKLTPSAVPVYAVGAKLEIVEGEEVLNQLLSSFSIS